MKQVDLAAYLEAVDLYERHAAMKEWGLAVVHVKHAMTNCPEFRYLPTLQVLYERFEYNARRDSLAWWQRLLMGNRAA